MLLKRGLGPLISLLVPHLHRSCLAIVGASASPQDAAKGELTTTEKEADPVTADTKDGNEGSDDEAEEVEDELDEDDQPDEDDEEDTSEEINPSEVAERG